MQLQGNTIAVIGLGKRTGASVVKFLCSKGARVVVFDEKDQATLKPILDDLKGFVFEFETGEPKSALEAQVWVVSPGVSSNRSYVRAAIERKITVMSELELASLFVSAPILAITGSAGKSTSVSLLGHILKEECSQVFVGGNLGTPLIDAAEQEQDAAVVEVSTFQMELTSSFSPKIAGLTNVFENHLDRHGTFETYLNLKLKMFQNMKKNSIAWFNLDDAASLTLSEKVTANRKFFSIKRKEKSDAFIEGSHIYCNHHKISLNGFSLLGEHNFQNALLSVGMAMDFGISSESIENALKTFRALPHRLEKVGEKNGVIFVNDSKSTSPVSTEKAIHAIEGSIVWIAGGRPKVHDFNFLNAQQRSKIKKAIFFGEAAREMAKQLHTLDLSVVENLKYAFDEAIKSAAQGDTVLFSPANTSFDQFTDYEERGNMFREMVHQWIKKETSS